MRQTAKIHRAAADGPSMAKAAALWGFAAGEMVSHAKLRIAQIPFMAYLVCLEEAMP